MSGSSTGVRLSERRGGRALDYDRLRSAMRERVVVDLRNVYRPEDLRAEGFIYASVGRA